MFRVELFTCKIPVRIGLGLGDSGPSARMSSIVSRTIMSTKCNYMQLADERNGEFEQHINRIE